MFTWKVDIGSALLQLKHIIWNLLVHLLCMRQRLGPQLIQLLLISSFSSSDFWANCGLDSG